MGFDLGAELAAVRGQGYELYSRYLNPQMPRALHTIGFDKDYVRGEGAYLYDAEGNAYADFLAGFGVFAAGRSHPVIKKALHDALDLDFAAWTQFDCPPIMGLLGQRLLAKARIPMVAVHRADARDIVLEPGHTRFTWRGLPVSTPLTGAVNVDNALLAAEAARIFAGEGRSP